MPFFGHEDDFPGAQVFLDLIIQVGERACFKRGREGSRFLADYYGGPSQPVAGRVDPVFRQQQDGAGPFDGFLRAGDPVDETRFLVDKRGHQLRGIDLSPAHLGEMRGAFPESHFYQGLNVFYDAHGNDGIGAEMRADDERLVLVIADDPDPFPALELRQVAVEFRAELRVGNIMDAALEARVSPRTAMPPRLVPRWE